MVWSTMSDVASIEELEAELNLNATSFAKLEAELDLNATSVAACSVETALDLITTRVREVAPHRVCSFRKCDTNTWDLMYEDFQIRFQLTSGNRAVSMWNVHDSDALRLTRRVDPSGVCVCFKGLVGLMHDRWLDALAQ